MDASTPSVATQPNDAASDFGHRTLNERPGFLIRRLHQIHVALFMEECAPEGITPVQYSLLTALAQLGPSEQVVLSRAVGLDRANTADVIIRLAQRKLLQSRVSRTDRRKKVAELTEIGRAVLARLETRVARAHERTIAALPAEARETFLDYLHLLVERNTEHSRGPLGNAGGQRNAARID
ncbi:MarR family winged helix-turn-helix transcriptional regulator [Chitinasiproducens palmae]|uniref:DNA-binding transcriptional regulator, MarR family n=1 Tax=Chitinasiproducens palmae TaxID=1770053 RepID=A0A1H2PPV7_9BURK|nr:MarR family transcriptional regulator [Chitinasiproducens palmae]SDV48839.1 DNA-binding transcriptional regulator, MarR family [Chitinasiproducens palmae]